MIRQPLSSYFWGLGRGQVLNLSPAFLQEDHCPEIRQGRVYSLTYSLTDSPAQAEHGQESIRDFFDMEIHLGVRFQWGWGSGLAF